MKNQDFNQDSSAGTRIPLRDIDSREWWLWGFAVFVTLILVAGIIALTFPDSPIRIENSDWFNLKQAVRGLAALVFLFDIYTLYQHFQLQRVRRQLADRNYLFQLITENAADMIAVVDTQGQRIYNSPAYQKVLGYSSEELKTSSFEQVHPEDRQRLIEAAEKARQTGRGERLEYRIRHKDGTWKVLESTASAVLNSKGVTEQLVIVNRDITQRKQAEDALAHNAFHDGLTNLPNRTLFLNRLQHALTLSKRHSNYLFAVLFIDIDQFKVFNDSLGHAAGNRLIIEIGERLTASLRGMDTISRPRPTQGTVAVAVDDTLARLGGDEFTVLLDDIKDPSDAVRVAERIQEKWATPFVIDGHEVVVTASIGIALSSVAYSEADVLLRDAEIAMYRAKRAGKARCELFDPAMHAAAVKRLRLETEIRKGLELREFKVYYQPIISLTTGRITGFEALSRWLRPEGMVPPLEFITVADETGLILPMNRQLMQDAAHQLCLWHSQFPSDPPLSMSVNVTSKQFAQPELAAEIELILKNAGLDPSYFHLEITETMTMDDSKRSEQMLADLKQIGCPISIDDFGTGYSSLSRLQKFPVDSLKIDRAFICNMDTDPESHEIVRLVIMLAHSLGMKVVAEGVDSETHIKQLCALGCESAQGFYFSKPESDETITNLLSTFSQALAVGAGR
jgi:PAS domain S-box-containing protein